MEGGDTSQRKTTLALRLCYNYYPADGAGEVLPGPTDTNQTPTDSSSSKADQHHRRLRVYGTHLLVMTLVLTVSTGCVAIAPIAEEAAPKAASAHSSELKPTEDFRHWWWWRRGAASV